MTAEQNIIAATVQFVRTHHLYLACLAEFEDDESACSEWADVRERQIEHLDQALRTAGIDVRDPAVWDTWRKGQGFDGR